MGGGGGNYGGPVRKISKESAGVEWWHVGPGKLEDGRIQFNFTMKIS